MSIVLEKEEVSWHLKVSRHIKRECAIRARERRPVTKYLESQALNFSAHEFIYGNLQRLFAGTK